MSVQSTELVIFVTHVEAEDTFLKIWGQVDKNSATCVERMILPLVEQFAKSQGCVGAQAAKLHINALCCARFQNEGYYRAKVINIQADGSVVLQFIDYGNIEVLPPQEIHLLENIPGSESLQSFPPVAFDFILMHVLPVNGIWENKIIESIKKTLWYNECKILIHSVVNNHRLIKLWYNNEDFSELLIKRHMATGATIQEMYRQKCIQQAQVPMYEQQSKRLVNSNCTTMAPVQNMNPLTCDGNEMHGLKRSVPLCCAAQQKHMMQTSVLEALVFKSRVLDVASKHDVYVSFVEDGPQKFSVQLQSTSQILSMLMRDINSHPIEPLQEPPLPGSVCLGRYTQDKVLCRAVVMSVMENKCKLYYVDFGHTEVLPYTDIFQLPPHFINPRVLSIRFTLSGVYELNVTDEMKEYFKRIVSGKLLFLHVRPPEGPPLVQYGDLYDDGKNIKDILRQAFPTPAIITPTSSSFGYQEPPKLFKNMEEIVHVSFVESCGKFFVQLESSIKSLELLMNNLADYCLTAASLNVTQLTIGLPCAALYNNQWYRAQILSINVDKIKVLYIDYGNESTVTLMALRVIHDELVKKLPAQALQCSLNNWESLQSIHDLHQKFEFLVLEERLHLKVINVNLHGIVVDLFDPKTMKNIRSLMLQKIGNEKKLINEPPNYQTQERQQITKLISNVHHSENSSKWYKRNQSDSWHHTQNNNTNREGPEKNKFKTWKDDSSEGNVQEHRNEKTNFHHNESRNERFNREETYNNKSTKDKWNSRSEYNDSFKSGKSTRGGKSKTLGYTAKCYSSDKTWSDKNSDTSSRGSSKRGRGNTHRRGYSKREGFFAKAQLNKFNDRDCDGSIKSGRMNSDSNYGNSRFKERKGQGYRLTQSKVIALNSTSDGEGRRYSPMRNRREFHIPPPNITVGATKTCEVVFTNSLFDFFVQLSPDFTALDSLMEDIASVYEIGGDLINESEISHGVYCIAQYSEDLKWYRAVIKAVDGKYATVQFVDYGNTEKVEFNNIKSIQKEFLKLPIQAINCKLFGIREDSSDKSNRTSFEDRVTGKTLEGEFITEENGKYSVLLKEVIDGWPTNTFINEEFCDGIELLKAKEEAVSGRTSIASMRQVNEPDYAPLDAKWTTTSFTLGTKKDVIVTWFTNPNNFYCQILDSKDEFRAMMKLIQKIYVGRKPISHMLQVGSPVIAVFSEDGALYRAEVMELNKLNGHLIHYIDFGNSAVVEFQKIYPVERKLMHLPKQAVQCSLQNVVPHNGLSWSKINTEAIDSCFNADKYECYFHDIEDNKYIISLINDGNAVANTLVERNLASFKAVSKSDTSIQDDITKKPSISYDVERMDISLLSGQTLRVKVSSVEAASKFYIQLPSAMECEDMIGTYMADKNPKVMQRLSAHEMCLGTGCLVNSNGVWRRAVINSHSQSTGFDVKFIDTGACDEILSDSVLALPGELSVMQNQAVECSLASVMSTPETDVSLKEHIEGKEIIVYVDKVDNSRLIVKIYDVSGSQINISEDSDERVSPVCPMPILSSTYKVSVSYADHSTSIWLQRDKDYALNKGLRQDLDHYYSTSGTSIEPRVDLLCAVKNADGHWYRAKIVKCTETIVYVNLIDYGNNIELARAAVMELDSRFYTPHQLAVNVSLPVTLNSTTCEQLSILQSYLPNKEFAAVFHNIDKKWVVELLHNGEKISDKFRSLNSVSQQGRSGTSKPHIHNMTVGCKYNVYVSHVDSPSQFWLHSIDDAKDLSDKQAELQIQAPTFSEIDGILEEGSLCVAVYTIDNLWYRSQVLDADEDITTVRFIDYGNTDVIDNKSGNIRQIPDMWKEIKEYAIKCRLDVIPIDSEDWNVATCMKFENLIMSVDNLQTMIVANSVPTRVDLLINGKSVSETLVEDHHALKVHTEEELIDEIVDLELDPHSAFVSHVNSPSEFWVQEEKSVSDLEVMTDRFIVADMFPKVSEIKENLLCVAKYPDDDCWYRARVISHSDNATRVLYVDYGNSATSTEIRAIPVDLADIPPLSRKCCLLMPEGITEWTEKACTEFIKLAADGATIFLLDVLKEDETSLVKLTLDNKNVTDILADFCEHFPPITEERLPPLGEENSPNVFVNRINSPDEFWIQTDNSITDLNMMLDRLQAAPSFLPLSTFDTGTVCAANYSEDGQWYRAKILSHSENGTEVLYIDYGNVAITNEIRMLPADIINIPPLAKRCALEKPDTINSWTPDICKTFEELAARGETMFQFDILDDTTDPIYVKLNLNGKNILDILVPFSKSVSQDAVVSKKEDPSDNTDLNSEIELTIKMEKQETKEEHNADTSGSDEVIESHDKEMKDNIDNSHLNTNSLVELTVDEIVQNMKMNEQGEDNEAFTSHNRTDKIDSTNAETKTVMDGVLLNVTETMTLSKLRNSSDGATDFENLEKQDNTLSTEIQVSTDGLEACESNTSMDILCREIAVEVNLLQLESKNEHFIGPLVERSSTSVTENNNCSTSGENKNDTKNYKTQDSDKVDLNIINTKDYSEVSSQSMEVGDNKSEITDEKTIVSVMDESSSEKINENNSVNFPLQRESTSTVSE